MGPCTRDYKEIATALGRGTIVADRVFDEVFPFELRSRSAVYWTPVEVAVRAAHLLAPRPGGTILDVGAGVGKFCLVAAAVVDAEVQGIEHRPHLVEVARAAAAKLEVNATFVDGGIADRASADLDDVDGFYFFNPFAENLCPWSDRLDATVELTEKRFTDDLAATRSILSNARLGSRVVTFCGLGGAMPTSFDLVSRERCGGGVLELWSKQREAEHQRPSERDPERT